MLDENCSQVDIAREYRYDGEYPYRTAGYRTDCRDYPFNEIMFMVKFFGFERF